LKSISVRTSYQIGYYLKMKQHLLIFSTLVLICVSCSKSNPDNALTKDTVAIDISNERNDIKVVDVAAIKIDTFENKDPSSVKTIAEIDRLIEHYRDNDSLVRRARKFIQLHENDSLIEVPGFDDKLEQFFASYSIVTENDKIVFISESPYSTEGDWYWVQQYYFYENGNIQAFSIQYSEFNSQVEGDMVGEELTCYYNESRELIKRKYRITDQDDRVIDFKKLDVVPTFHDAVSVTSLIT